MRGNYLGINRRYIGTFRYADMATISRNRYEETGRVQFKIYNAVK